MNNVFVRLIAVLGLPILSFWLGSMALTALSGRGAQPEESRPKSVEKEDHRGWLQRKLCGSEDDHRKLYIRFCGYDRGAVERHWQTFQPAGFAVERKFLELDLIFPFLYAGGLAAGLLLAWATLGRPCHPAWVVAPAALAAIADWTENLVQWGQLRRFLSHEELQAGWIQLASAATTAKLAFVVVGFALLVALALAVLIHTLRAA